MSNSSGTLPAGASLFPRRSKHALQADEQLRELHAWHYATGKEAAVQRSAVSLTPQLECWMQQVWPDWVRPGSQEAGRVKLLSAGRPCWQPRLHAAGVRACAGPLDLPL